MKQFRRVAVAVGILAITLIPQAAEANPPTRFPSQPSVGPFAAGTLCQFPIDVEAIGSPQTETLFYDSGGNVVRIAFTGSAYFSLKNSISGKTVVVNASGQGTFRVQSDRSLVGSGSGPGLIGLFPTDQGGPALLYVLGHETFNVSPTGRISNLAIVGSVTDLCAVLAG